MGDDVFSQLSFEVQRRYGQSQMDGVYILKLKGEKFLVSLVSVKPGPDMQRLAQVKARRQFGEFLQGVKNESVTVYEVIDSKSYKMEDETSEISVSLNVANRSTIEQNSMDKSTKTTEETFTDKTIQRSFARVSHMESLVHFVGNEGFHIFVYYIIL